MNKAAFRVGLVFLASFVLVCSVFFVTPAFSDNLVNSGGTVKFVAGSSGSITVKIVSNTASAEKGDPQQGCNAADGSPAMVTLTSQPSGLNISPQQPMSFSQCGVTKTVTFSSDTPGTYTVSAALSDSGNGVYHLDPFGDITVIVQSPPPLASITINPITPNPVPWGVSVSASGTVTGAQSNNKVNVDWGDNTSSPNLPISGGLWTATHAYSAPGTYSVVATLKSGGTTLATSDAAAVTVQKHGTSLDAFGPADVTGDTGFTIGGTLRDETANGAGISGKVISFDGTGATPSLQSVTTQGVKFTGVVSITSCVVSNSGPCSVDNIGTDSNTANNKVLHLNVGGKITFPEGTSEVKLFLQEMGTTSFKYRVVEYDGTIQNCINPLDGQNCPTSSSAFPLVAFLDTASGFTTDNGVTVFNGIKEITITEVNGSTSTGNVGLAAIVTMNSNGKEPEQRQINFEDLTAGTKTSPFTVEGGSYFSIGIAQFAEEDGLEVQAHFDGDSLYEGSDSDVITYNVQSNLGNLAGIGGESITGDGISITKYDCSTIGSTDSDKDGICSTWETTGIVSIPSGTYVLPETPAGDSVPDVYFEIDSMSGFAPTQAEINIIKNIFDKKGIKLHVQLDETSLAVKNPFHVWTDTDTNPDNDYVKVKNNHFGTVAERDKAAGSVGDSVFGSLGQGSGLLEAKLHVVRYTVFVQNINSGTTTTCGTSGVAELQGNDAVVALGCGFGLNPSEERLGTLMHEWGHNLGLRHGGNDDENCKPNQKSVMSYAGQIPWSLLPKPTAGQTTNIGWYLGYSSQALTSLNENAAVNDGFVLSIDPTKWKTMDGVTAVSSFKFVWGTPQLTTKIQSGTTGTAVNWDKDANSNEQGQTIDLNYMSITLGTQQIPACTPANSAKSTLQTYDEWAIIKTKLNFRSMGTLDGLGVSTHTDPDDPNEPIPELYDSLNGLANQFSGVKSPLNNLDYGQTGTLYSTKKGNTIPAQFNLFDSSGNEVTGANALSGYHIQNVTLKVAAIGTSLPADDDYKSPGTSTQTGFTDFFTYDGSKWSFQFGTKNLTAGKTYAARIYLVMDTGEQIVLDKGQDGITFLFKLTN